MKLNKKQKRTATIASMAALLAVVLGMGGQTFAKYITTNTTTAQTATVAKWDLVLNQQSESNAFLSNNYKNGDNTVVSADHAVVAPGTSGTITYVIEGKAEVDAKVTFSMTNYDAVKLDDYEPIVWKVNGTAINPANWSVSQNYEANTTASNTVTITWEWAFSDAEAGVIGEKDKKDTLLAQITAQEGIIEEDKVVTYKGTNYNVDNTLSFQLTAVIEQVR